MFDGKRLTEFFGPGKVKASALSNLKVHTDLVIVKNLTAVHAQVGYVVIRVPGEGQG